MKPSGPELSFVGRFLSQIRFHCLWFPCSYYLFLPGSVLEACTFIRISPFLPGCPFDWHIVACISLLWSSVFLWFQLYYLLFHFSFYWFESSLFFSWWVCCCSVAKSCPTLCDSISCSSPGFPVLHYPPEFAHTLVHWVGDDIQLSHPLWHIYPPSLNLSKHQGLWWV